MLVMTIHVGYDRRRAHMLLCMCVSFDKCFCKHLDTCGSISLLLKQSLLYCAIEVDLCIHPSLDYALNHVPKNLGACKRDNDVHGIET